MEFMESVMGVFLVFPVGHAQASPENRSFKPQFDI
jgi:hypothetical protein